MMKSPWTAFAFALLITGGLAGPAAFPAEAQGYRDGDRGRDDRDWDRRRDDRRGGRWDEDDRDARRGPGFRFEFGGRDRDRDRQCRWVSRRYVDDDGDVVIRRRQICD
jgi:hypothetical protein